LLGLVFFRKPVDINVSFNSMADSIVSSAGLRLPRPGVKACWPPLALMGFIFLLSSVPGNTSNQTLRILVELKPQWQNLLHIPLFGLLQILWLRSFSQGNRVDRTAVWCCIGISLAYGAFDECHQLLVLGRYASLLDMALNLVGVSLATLGFLFWNRSSQRVVC
jgi:VanZ family protein